MGCKGGRWRSARVEEEGKEEEEEEEEDGAAEKSWGRISKGICSAHSGEGVDRVS